MFATTVSICARLISRGRCSAGSSDIDVDSESGSDECSLRLKFFLIAVALTEFSHCVVSGTAAVEATNTAVRITLKAARKIAVVDGGRGNRSQAHRSWIRFSLGMSVLCLSQVLPGATVTSLWARDLVKLGLFAAFIDSARAVNRNA
ncbi:hypothetical protein [Paraburkholderia caledonica]|uniref:Secreted protein n=1 Tax=Paraburkholderia caledonica TaxID=134536 RepID=A0ABU1KYW8_9BURK|nr:hypothetical protein [Paraburkholderia caledonica]MDR6376156.1 hypothetical protein [Paraburkholderia caledonica]